MVFISCVLCHFDGNIYKWYPMDNFSEPTAEFWTRCVTVISGPLKSFLPSPIEFLPVLSFPQCVLLADDFFQLFSLQIFFH